MSANDVMLAPPTVSDHASTDDPEALMDRVWALVELIGERAIDPDRYRVDLIREGVERGDLNLIEIGLHRFRDVEPLDGEDD